ncbi:MAG: carboxylating nicotinate-nucleotide diphosphorylase [Myxococcota bacterium]
MTRSLFDKLLDLALEEDLGHGDITTDSVVPADAKATAKVLAKQPMVVFGLRHFSEVFYRLDARINIERLVEDGAPVAPGTVVANLSGPARAILTGERTALNLLMRLSGIATMTRAMSTALRDYPNCRLLDTRKTTPGMRSLEKEAVRAGGGANHRMGLFDGVLIKDNHIAVAGGVAEAIRRAKAGNHHLVKIECEVVDIPGVEAAISAGADAILLDNMDDATTAQAVKLIRAAGRPIFIEASGNMNIQRIPRVAALGVDGISVGALTHSATSVDLSLEFQPA